MQTASTGLDDASFRQLSEIVYKDSGIVLSDSKRNLLVSRLSNRLRELRMLGFSEYCQYLKSPSGKEEKRKLTPLITTNLTRFFREEHHFDALRNDLLPPLINRALNGGSIRIWSAGCSTGEEPYSIAMVLLDLMPTALDHDVRILATDIDPVVVQTGRAGIYFDIEAKHFPKSAFEKYLVPKNDGSSGYSVCQQLRDLVTLNELNLLHDWPMKRMFDIIFCRNVVIYFDPETQLRLWKKFADQLPTGGQLIVGHSERVNIAKVPELQHSGTTRYRKT